MENETALDASLVTQTLNFHGQQLQKIWESERGETDLSKIGVGQLDFAAYQARQKHLTFQDRGKRLILHQFITKEANALFDSNIMSEAPAPTSVVDANDDNVYAVMPPFETFLNVDKAARLRHFFQNIITGELIIGTVINRNASGMMLKVLCTAGANPRYVADINVKAFLPVSNIIPAMDKKNVSRNYLMNDTVCCEVLEVIPDTDKISCGMKGVTRGADDPSPKPPLGLISTDDFPHIYKKSVEMKGESYEAILEKSPGFNNPNCISFLSDLLGVGSNHYSNFLTLRGRFPPQEYADELRQAQASKWAFRSVAEGIEHFKAGRHSEAFQCLNKALSIDPRNVEGLVARGALYANSGTFKKAIEDFETSLKLNPSHANARKYMGETLVALGRSYEDENKIAEAQKAYEDCLAIIPFHEEAQNSLDFLKSKSNIKPLIEPAELLLPGLTANKSLEMKETLKQLLNLTEKKDKKKKKKKNKGKKKHHRSSSSSSSSSDSSSSSSSSDSSSSSSESSDTDGPQRKKKRRSRSHNKKQRSLSPLSKRMALIEPSLDKSHNSQFNHPYGWTGGAPPPEPEPAAAVIQPPAPQDLDYEMKVRKFLEMTKEGSDYENKVRNFLEETARYKRDRKMQELGTQEHEKSNKARKKAKKESKKSKKESKRKRKEREREERRKSKLNQRNQSTSGDYLRDFDQNMGDKKFRDALRKELSHKPSDERRRSKRDMSPEEGDYDRKRGSEKRILDDMPDFEELESKLNAYYAKVEKDTGLSSKRQDNGRPPNDNNFPPSPLSRSVSPDDKPKWKMLMNASKDKVKKKETTGKSSYKDKSYAFEDSSDESERREPEANNKGRKPLMSPDDKNISVRRAMALKEPPPKHIEPEPPGTEEQQQQQQQQQQQLRPKQNVVLDKFGSFRLAKEGEGGEPISLPVPPGGRHSPRPSQPTRRGRSPSESRESSPRRRSSRSRSRPRKYRSRSSGASRSSSSGGSAQRRPRRSPPTRSEASRSPASRSRSRTRSRSTSRDRFRRMNRRGGWRGRGGYERGTYYKPRFHPYGQRGNNNNNNRGRGGQDFRRDDRRFDWRDRGNRRPFRSRQRGNNRGRPFRGGYRDFRDRRNMRFSRSRSPDARRRSRSYSPDERRQDKDKVDRYSERDSHRSEGEYEEERYVDRKEYDGKWADTGGGEGGGGGGGGSRGVEMDKPREPSPPKAD